MPDLNVGLEEIGLWLESRVAGFTLGQNLQINHFVQDAPDRATALMNNSGIDVNHFPPRTRVDFMLQVYSRALYWNEARDDNYKFFKYLYDPKEALIYYPNQASPIFRIDSIIVTGGPQGLPPDDKNRKQMSSNYMLIINIL